MIGIYTENYGTMIRHTVVLDWVVIVLGVPFLMGFTKERLGRACRWYVRKFQVQGLGGMEELRQSS